MNKKYATVRGREILYRKRMSFTQPEDLFDLLSQEANAAERLYENYIQWKLSLPVNSILSKNDEIQEIRNPDQYYRIAKNFAIVAHAGQKREGGDDFIVHPIAVAEKMDDIDQKTVAILHDVIEDNGATYDDLLSLGIPFWLVVHVKHLTRLPDEPYTSYILRVKDCAFCKPIKVEDIRHNASTITKNMLKEKPNIRQKYQDALNTLFSI